MTQSIVGQCKEAEVMALKVGRCQQNKGCIPTETFDVNLIGIGVLNDLLLEQPCLVVSSEKVKRYLHVVKTKYYQRPTITNA